MIRLLRRAEMPLCARNGCASQYHVQTSAAKTINGWLSWSLSLHAAWCYTPRCLAFTSKSPTAIIQDNSSKSWSLPRSADLTFTSKFAAASIGVYLEVTTAAGRLPRSGDLRSQVFDTRKQPRRRRDVSRCVVAESLPGHEPLYDCCRSRLNRSFVTASLHAKILEFRGFYTSIILMLRGDIFRPIGDSPDCYEFSRDNICREIGCIVGSLFLSAAPIQPTITRPGAPGTAQSGRRRGARAEAHTASVKSYGSLALRSRATSSYALSPKPCS